jgi:hypothetical protein
VFYFCTAFHIVFKILFICFPVYINFYYYMYRTRHRGGSKNYLDVWKTNRFLASYSFRKNDLFKESPPSIMVTRNPNWSTEILWYGTGYVNGKILSPLKRSAWGRLHCWFCQWIILRYDNLLIIFLTLASVNIQLRISPTLALVNIT